MSDGDWVGTTIRLKGTTQHGKNRINRGGELFRVVRYSEGYGYFLESVDGGVRERFWARLPKDTHVAVIEGGA